MQANRVCKLCERPEMMAIVLVSGWTAEDSIDCLCEACYQEQKEAFLSRRNENQRLGMISDLISHASRLRVPVTKDSFVIPDEILPGKLFLGSRHASGNLERLTDLGIGQIIVCCSSLPAYFADSSAVPMRYLRLPLSDSVDQDLGFCFRGAMDFINEGYAHQSATLVHCQEGISRSSSIVIAYLILHEKMSFPEAYEHVAARRSVISPNKHFKAQLRALTTGNGEKI